MAAKIVLFVSAQILLFQLAFGQFINSGSGGLAGLGGLGGLSGLGGYGGLGGYSGPVNDGSYVINDLIDTGSGGPLGLGGYGGLGVANYGYNGIVNPGFGLGSGALIGGVSGIGAGFGSGAVVGGYSGPINDGSYVINDLIDTGSGGPLGYGGLGGLGVSNYGYNGVVNSGLNLGLGSGAVVGGVTGIGAGFGGAVVGGLNNLGVTSSGPLLVTAVSPIGPSGLAVASENVIEGILTVTGELPYLSVVAFDGSLPTSGSGVATCGCGNGAVGIISEGFTNSPVATPVGYGAPLGLGGYGPIGIGPNPAGIYF